MRTKNLWRSHEAGIVARIVYRRTARPLLRRKNDPQSSAQNGGEGHQRQPARWLRTAPHPDRGPRSPLGSDLRSIKDTDIDREDKKCKGMEGILKENEDLLKEDAEPEVLDAGMIAGAQRVEHYEIAAYSTVRTYASLLGNQSWAQLLQQTLDGEKQTDQN